MYVNLCTNLVRLIAFFLGYCGHLYLWDERAGDVADPPVLNRVVESAPLADEARRGAVLVDPFELDHVAGLHTGRDEDVHAVVLPVPEGLGRTKDPNLLLTVSVRHDGDDVRRARFLRVGREHALHCRLGDDDFRPGLELEPSLISF